ncbi:MAG: recombination protein RmuC [Pseudomonadota bacterium]|jgi:DNA recombination protein RmuC
MDSFSSSLVFLMTFLVAGLAFAFGWFAAGRWYRSRLQQLQRELDLVQLQRETEEKLYSERLQNNLNTLAQRALQENTQNFLQLARETFGRAQGESQADLEQRQLSIQHLVAPIRDALAKNEEQIRQIEKERHASAGMLTEQLRGMMHEHHLLRRETGRLASALRTPSARGQWGELSLRRIAELAGMIEYCDFMEQVQRSNEERTIRPDMLVRMPGKRDLIIDAKAPMDAYLDAVDADQEEVRTQHLQRHAKRVREHVRLLASKRYWEQFAHAPDFVVLFIPGEQFLGAALEHDHQLLQDALQLKVILATPATLMALLRTLAYGWRQNVLAENAHKVRDLGEEVHRRLAAFLEHFEKLGRNLSSNVETYNQALGSLERSVMPSVRRLAELGVSSGRNIATPTIVEVVPRQPSTKGFETNAEKH